MRDKVLIPAAAALRVIWCYLAKCARYIYRAVKGNKLACKAIKICLVILIALIAIYVYTRSVAHNAADKAVAEYKAHLAQVQAEEEEAARLAALQDPYKLQLDAEADALARVLYGVRDNDTDDLKTYCWCVFNRVDNPSFPSTLEDVIAQPNQWMRYDPTNPVLENLYQIAREQLNAWHTDAHRPVSNEYVFMAWSAKDICLRDNFHEGSNCHYWRFNQ